MTSYLEQHIQLCQQYEMLGLLGQLELTRILAGRDLDKVHTTSLHEILLFLTRLGLIMCRDDCDVTDVTEHMLAIQEELNRREKPP